jgi:hypothetical protein
MRIPLLLLLALVLPASLSAQAEKRYGIAADAKTFPQATPKEALASVLKAIEAKKFDYLVARLAEPGFIDDRVKRLYGGKFEEQVADTRTRLDPPTVKQLGKFLKDGKWTVDKTSALVQLDDVKDRVVRLVNKDGAWYLSHRFDPPVKD